jgi:hypothetical protein
MSPCAQAAALRAQNHALRQDAQRLLALAREVVHDANNLILQARMRRKLAERTTTAATPSRMKAIV